MLQVLTNAYSGQRQARHAHAETSITIVLSGHLRERVGRDEESADPLSIVVKPSDTEHETEFSEHVRTLQILIADSEVNRLHDASRVFRSWRWQHGGPAVPAFLRLVRVYRAHSAVDEPAALANAAYDALGALTDTSTPTSTQQVPPRWLSIVRELVEDSPDLPVSELAARADVHPVYLARQFRRWYGHSITEHVVRRRVQRAAAAIASTDRRLSTISYETGFADQAHLCRLFARTTGVTPSAYRALVAG